MSAFEMKVQVKTSACTIMSLFAALESKPMADEDVASTL